MIQVRSLHGAWAPRLPKALAVVLSLLIAADAARFSMLLYRAISGTAPSIASVPPVPGPSPIPVAQIRRAHLFGVAPQSARGAESAASAEAPHTEWLLTGTLATLDPQRGYAIMESRGKASAGGTWPAGALLPDHVRLARIYIDRVVLESDGHQETLRLPRSMATTLTAITLHPGAEQQLADAQEETSDDGVTDPSIVMDPTTLTPAESLFDRLRADPQQIGGSYQMVLHPGPADRHELGLQPGDVLTAINGVPLKDRASVTSALRDASGTVSFTVLRNGQAVTADLPIGN